MKDEQSIENFKKPIFESKSPSNYVTILFCLILTLVFVLNSTKETLWASLIAGIVISSIVYLSSLNDINIFIVFDDSIIIKYPHSLFHKKYKFTFTSIQGILFDDSENHRSYPLHTFISVLSVFRPHRYSGNWNRMIFYYTDDEGIKREKAIDYTLDQGDLRRIISLLGQSGVNIKGAEKYIEVK